MIPINPAVDGKRDERLRGDCWEAEGSRPEPLGQAHGVEMGGPTLLSRRAGQCQKPRYPEAVGVSYLFIPEAASASGPVTLFEMPGGSRPAGASVCALRPSTMLRMVPRPCGRVRTGR